MTDVVERIRTATGASTSARSMPITYVGLRLWLSLFSGARGRYTLRNRSSTSRSSREWLALAHPSGSLRCGRFPAHPERLYHRPHAPYQHEDSQD